MRGKFEDIIGKTITDVYCQENSTSPRGQIFLLFDNETSFEIYADGSLKSASGLDKGDLNHIKKCNPKR